MHSLRHNESGVKVLAKKAVSSVYSSSQTRTHHVDSLILLDSSSSLWMLLFADGLICVVTAAHNGLTQQALSDSHDQSSSKLKKHSFVEAGRTCQTYLRKDTQSVCVHV